MSDGMPIPDPGGEVTADGGAGGDDSGDAGPWAGLGTADGSTADGSTGDGSGAAVGGADDDAGSMPGGPGGADQGAPDGHEGGDLAGSPGWGHAALGVGSDGGSGGGGGAVGGVARVGGGIDAGAGPRRPPHAHAQPEPLVGPPALGPGWFEGLGAAEGGESREERHLPGPPGW